MKFSTRGTYPYQPAASSQSLCTFVRNEQKKAKKARYETEKEYMQALQSAGNEVGEYVGDGQGETETVGDDHPVVVDADPDVDDPSVEQDEDSSDDAQPVLFLYDCETTGLSIYNDHIIEIAAEVMNSHASHSFSKLVKTSRRIKAEGIITKEIIREKIDYKKLF